jgi:MFS family permease
LVGFVAIERHVKDPMFQMHLFASRSFTMGNLAGLMLALARGGLQFILIIWLQGIWLPLHGYSFARTPLWAGIYMVPLTVGFFVAGPLAGKLADRFGARPFATAGLVLTGLSLLGLQFLPTNFSYLTFAVLLFAVGISMGLFAAPNSSAVMNSLPIDQRGAGSGMLNTFQNSASVLSIGFFFTVITLGLASSLPRALLSGLSKQGVPRASAVAISHLSPIGSLFSAFLGINPMRQLLGPKLLAQPGVHATVLTSRSFFPNLIAGAFGNGLRAAFIMAAVVCFIGAVFSWLRGPGVSTVHHSFAADVEEGLAGVADVAMAEAGVGAPASAIEAESSR